MRVIAAARCYKHRLQCTYSVEVPTGQEVDSFVSQSLHLSGDGLLLSVAMTQLTIHAYVWSKDGSNEGMHIVKCLQSVQMHVRMQRQISAKG